MSRPAGTGAAPAGILTRSAEKSTASAGAHQHSNNPARTHSPSHARLAVATIKSAISNIHCKRYLHIKSSADRTIGPVGATSLMPDRASCRDPGTRYSVYDSVTAWLKSKASNMSESAGLLVGTY